MHTATIILFFSSISTTQFCFLLSPTTNAVIPLSSLLLDHTATVTLFPLLLLHHHIYYFVVVLFSPPIRNGYVVVPSLKATGRLYCRLILLYNTAAAAFSSLLYDHHNFVVVLFPRPHFHGYVVFYSPTLAAQFLSSSFLSHRAAPIILSTPLHNHHQRHLCGYVVFPPPPSPSTSQLFGRPSSTPGGYCYFSPLPPTYHSYWYVIFLLPPPPPQLYCRLSLFTTLPRLSCLSSFTTPSRLCCLLFSTTITTKKLQKSCLSAVNPVTVLAKVLAYFVFSFTLLHSKMWYSCGHNGRDRLWKNLPYSVHVWITIRTRRTQEHVAHEGKKPLTIVNLIYSFL